MSDAVKAAALFFAAVLGGMETAYGCKLIKGEQVPFYHVWKYRSLYAGTAIWLMLLGFAGIYGHARYLYMLLTYVMLTVIDYRYRIVPDFILICYLLGQLLMMVSIEAGGISVLVCGGMFALVMILWSAFSGGRMGMGDAKLLGVTAMTAGWMYTVQLLFGSLFLSFLYGLWRLVFCKADRQEEMPFVPFLLAGIVLWSIL